MALELFVPGNRARDRDVAPRARRAIRHNCRIRRQGYDMLFRSTRRWLGLAFLLVATTATAQQDLFPRPEGLEADIEFWRRVYTEVDTSSGFIHDTVNLGVVYRTLRFSEDVSRRQRNRIIRAAYDEIRAALGELAKGKRTDLTDEERRVLAAWPEDVTSEELNAGAGRLRFQLGQSDRFRSGLIRSGTWKPYIISILEQRGLPLELAALPHVESSFDPTAYSKVGAAGMWQFTRSTGLRYMRIDHVVDERRDPYFSTTAAARLLQNNFDVLETWPLALTAYNHGVSGMRNAVRQQKTRDIETIVRNYKGRTFGFASRNFYVAFLAALEIDRDPERYFGELSFSRPAESLTVSVPDFVHVNELGQSLGLSPRELRYWNPALTESVWSGDKFVPRGFELRVPVTLGVDPAARLAAIPATARYTAQVPDIYHRVGRGDTISQIAERYGVSMRSLVELNGLRSRNLIRAGEVLRLPGNGDAMPVTLADGAGGTAGPVSTYVVRRGDSVNRIARRFGMTEAALLARNGIADRNLIYAGQELRVDDADPSEEIVAVNDAVVVAAAVSAPAPAAAEPTLPDASPSAMPLAAVDTIIDRDVDRGRLLADERRLLTTEAALATIMDPGLEADTVDSDDLALSAALDSNPDGDIDLPVIDSAEGASEPVIADANALGSEQAELAADPSNYLVGADQTIEVQALETLGHYADWLGLPTQRLRDINGLEFDRAVVIGERLKLEFDAIDVRTFEQRRVDYQQSTQEAFFSSYQITETVEHVIRPGESLWILARRHYQVPVWLLRQFNPDLDFDLIKPGMVVKFPSLRAIGEAGTPTQAAL
jgi:membrane-bound lytic murein transglycosylase D